MRQDNERRDDRTVIPSFDGATWCLRWRRLRSAEQRLPPRFQHRRRSGRRSDRRCGRETARPRRQGLAARNHLDVLRRQRLALEQRRCNGVQEVQVLAQHVLRALVCRRDDALHLGVHELRRLLAHLAPMLDLAPQKQFLLVVADENGTDGDNERSEEHTSELQSRQYLVCRLLLEKKKYSPRRPPTASSRVLLRPVLCALT